MSGFTLSTGRHVYAHRGLVSIPIVDDGKADPREFWEGYDGGFSVIEPFHDEEDKEYYLSIDEGIEVCDLMLKAWAKRKSDLEALNAQKVA